MYLPNLTVQDGLQDTVCTGTSSIGCHGIVHLGIHISRATKLYVRLIKTFAFPPCRDRIMRCWLINWTCSRGHRSCIGREALEHQALWHLPEFRANCKCFRFSVSLGRVSFVVRRIRHLGHEVFGAPVLKCTPGEAHTWMRSCFHFNQGFLSNF